MAARLGSSMISVQEALNLIQSEAAKHLCPAEDVVLDQAHGRILAQPMIANHDQPPFRASAMDGYACLSEGLSTLPATLEEIGTSSAGHPFSGRLTSGQTLRVFTGSALPQEADTIVIQEHCTRQESQVTVNKTSSIGTFIRPQGYDVAKGQTLVTAGTILNARALGLAASAGLPSLSLYRKPRISLLSSGDELVTPGSILQAGQIYASNDKVIANLIPQWGGSVINKTLVKDKLNDLTQAIERALTNQTDVLVCLGGASVGDFDLTHQALKQAGMTPIFHKIAMRPGKPLIYGKIGNMQVLGLPGNPVSSYVCTMMFLQPLLKTMQGQNFIHKSITCQLGDALPENSEREAYLRAKLTYESNGSLTAWPMNAQDSAQFHALYQADALIIRPPHREAAEAGELCKVLLIND